MAAALTPLLEQISLYQKYGPHGITIQGDNFKVNFFGRFTSFFSRIWDSFPPGFIHRLNVDNLLTRKISELNTALNRVTDNSPELTTYYQAKNVINVWNRQFGSHSSFKIHYEGKMQVVCRAFDNSLFDCYFVTNQKLPLVISPRKGNRMTTENLQNYIQKNRPLIQEVLNQYGALAFRGFEVDTCEKVKDVVETVFNKPLVEYIGDAPRPELEKGKKVYAATMAGIPKDFKINFHHEGLLPNTYESINLACFIAPPKGTGQTLLLRIQDFDKAVKADTNLWNVFHNRTIEYVENLPSRDSWAGWFYTWLNPSHNSWQQCFKVETKEDAEKICEQRGYIRYHWNGNWLELITQVPATRLILGEHRIYTQVYNLHPNPRARGGWFNHLGASFVYFFDFTKQFKVCYKNGTAIPTWAMYKIYDIFESYIANNAHFEWEKGDLLIVKNEEVLHGRAPFHGDRKVVTVFIGPFL